VQDVAERSRDKSNLLQGYGDAVLRAEALEEQLVKSRKHAAAMQSKLDAAFAKYHNDVQELQAKGDDLVRKNKGLRNKNKHFVFFSDPSNQSYPLVRSFKAFLSSGVLFLVCLFVCLLCVCLCPMIDASRMNVVREHGRV
jgi:hypothetical protein